MWLTLSHTKHMSFSYRHLRLLQRAKALADGGGNSGGQLGAKEDRCGQIRRGHICDG